MSREMVKNDENLKYIELTDNYIIANDSRYSIMLAKLQKVEKGKEKGKWAVINRSYHYDLKSVVKKMLNDMTLEAIEKSTNLKEVIQNLEEFEERLFNSVKNISIKDLML